MNMTPEQRRQRLDEMAARRIARDAENDAFRAMDRLVEERRRQRSAELDELERGVVTDADLDNHESIRAALELWDEPKPGSAAEQLADERIILDSWGDDL